MTFAITLSLFLVGLIALVADLSTLFGASALVNQAAQSGAYAAAADADLAYFRLTGTVRLKQDGSVDTVCQAAITAAMGRATPSPRPTCTVDLATPYQVTVTVSYPVPLPVSFGFPRQIVSATYSAFAQSGTTIPRPGGP